MVGSPILSDNHPADECDHQRHDGVDLESHFMHLYPRGMNEKWIKFACS
jgi:hypothetical protein